MKLKGKLEVQRFKNKSKLTNFRRLVQEAIEEVVAGASLTDPAQENLNGAQDSLDDIELMLERRGLKQGGFANENFANRIRRATASTQRTPDMDRDCDESFNKSLNVTIRDIHRTDPDLHNLNGSDPLPVATPDDLAALGMFTGQIGRPLMDKISSLRNPSLPQSSPLRKSARQISLPNVFTPEPIPDNFISDEFGETPVELPSIPHMEPNNVSGVQVTTPKLAPSAQAAQETIGPMHEVSSTRHEAFERIVSQIEKQAQEQSRTPRRRRQRRAIREQRGIDAGEILEFNKPLIWHKIKTKATKTRKPEAQLRLILDIYEDLGEYEQDAIDLLDTEEPPPIEIPALQPIKESQFNIPTVLETTKPSVKRSRMSEDKENDAPAQVSVIEPSAQFDGTPFFVPKMSLPSRISALRDQMNPNRHFQTPIVDFVPQHTSTAGRKTRPPFQLTLEDMEEARLNYISEQPRLTGLSNFGVEQNDGDKLGELPSFVDVPQNIVVGDKSSAAAPTKTAGDRAQPEEHFRKVVKDGETMIEYVGVNGTVERQSEYCLEVRLLTSQRTLQTFIFSSRCRPSRCISKFVFS